MYFVERQEAEGHRFPLDMLRNAVNSVYKLMEELDITL